MNYLWAFIVGGVLCAVGQLFIDLTKLTPARIRQEMTWLHLLRKY